MLRRGLQDTTGYHLVRTKIQDLPRLYMQPSRFTDKKCFQTHRCQGYVWTGERGVTNAEKRTTGYHLVRTKIQDLPRLYMQPLGSPIKVFSDSFFLPIYQKSCGSKCMITPRSCSKCRITPKGVIGFCPPFLQGPTGSKCRITPRNCFGVIGICPPFLQGPTGSKCR